MIPIIEVKNLSKIFYVPKYWYGKQKIEAVKPISFSLDKGQTLAIIGENGAGKSTLAKLLAGSIRPTSGHVWIENKKLNFGQYRLRSQLIRMIFQNPDCSFDPRLNTGQLLDLILKHHSINEKERYAIIYNTLNQVGLLPDHVNYYPITMATGQKQRVALARALILQPKVIIADEALAAIDISMRAQIINLMLELQKKYNLSYVIVTQDIGIVKHMSDKIIVMHEGAMVEYSDTEALFANPQSEVTVKLINSYFNGTATIDAKRQLKY